jgi:putative iron-regulated protein
MKLSKTKLLLTSLSVTTALALSGCAHNQNQTGTKSQKECTKSQTVLGTYADIALANYTDALNDAKGLQSAIDKFIANPTAQNMEEAKAAWLKSRESYGESEIFRLSNGPIDAEEGWVADTYGALEGQINAWPLDENMIDYTIDANGNKTSGNIIDTIGAFNPGGEGSTSVDVSNITIDAITTLNENGGEANVASGYHAVEFLLWGQDQDYANFVKDGITNGPLTAGQRELSDFTTDANAQRRMDYLKASTDKIVADLEIIKGAWEKQVNGDDGLYRKAFLGKGANAISKEVALKQIFSGMGVFMKSELANERIAVAVLTPSEEDEHSCFSDNTHRDITTNYQGFKNILLGTYRGKHYGKAPIDSVDKETKEKILTLMSSIEDKIASMNAIADTSRHFDYQIRPNDPQAKQIVKLKNEMRKLGDMMVPVAKAHGVTLGVDDVTDAEETKI